MKDAIVYLLIIFGGFILGNIPFSYLIPKLFLKKDICIESDDHNPGAANAFKLCGPIVGMTCLIFDFGKGYAPVLLAYKLVSADNILFSAVMIAPVLGHATGMFMHFKGGKCIASAFGTVAAVLPETRVGLILAGVYILFSTVFKITPNTKRSIAAFSVFGVLSFVILICEGQLPIALGCVGISLIAIYRHKKSAGAFAASAESETDAKAEEV